MGCATQRDAVGWLLLDAFLAASASGKPVIMQSPRTAWNRATILFPAAADAREKT